MEVLGNSSVYHFDIPELPLHYKERMLYLAARRGLAVLNLLLPVDPFIGVGCLQAAGTNVGAILYF